jgi:oxalate decarboxylase/phosphoglucose isomerase-like protein (cupin superfamily)
MAILHIGPSADVSICRRRKGQNLQAGHVGYVLMSVSHFIENIGDTPSKSLNCFARYMDVSLA